MSKVIAIANNKGGVAKTTTAANMATIFANKGKRILLIDLDGQAHLTDIFVPQDADFEETIYEAMVGKISKLPIIESNQDNIDIVPASDALALLDVSISNKFSRERILKKLIKPVRDVYDYIILDCPPALGITVLNAFVACDDLIVPLRPEYLSIKGTSTLYQFISAIQGEDELNPNLHITGILVTMWEKTNDARENESFFRSQPFRVFDTKIRKNIKVAEAPKYGQTVVNYCPKCNGSIDYNLFVQELEGIWTNEHKK